MFSHLKFKVYNMLLEDLCNTRKGKNIYPLTRKIIEYLLQRLSDKWLKGTAENQL